MMDGFIQEGEKLLFDVWRRGLISHIHTNKEMHNSVVTHSQSIPMGEVSLCMT